MAKAFGVSVERNRRLVQIIDEWSIKTAKTSTQKPSESRYKLAEIPSNAKLNFATHERAAAAKLKGIEASFKN